MFCCILSEALVRPEVMYLVWSLFILLYFVVRNRSNSIYIQLIEAECRKYVRICIIGRRQAIFWTNGGTSLIGMLGTNFTDILCRLTSPILGQSYNCRNINETTPKSIRKISTWTPLITDKYGNTKPCVHFIYHIEHLKRERGKISSMCPISASAPHF